MRLPVTMQATRQQLVVFSGIVLPLMGIATGLLSYRWLGWGVSATGCAAFTLLGILGLVAPNRIKPLYFAWRAGGEFLGKIITVTVLTFCFLAVILPVGLLLRLLGRTPIHSAHQLPKMKSHWKNRDSQSEKSQYFRQY